MFADDLLKNLKVEIKQTKMFADDLLKNLKLEIKQTNKNVCRRFAEELESGDDQEDKEAKSHL